jgi:hypothetical protein
MLYDLIRDTSTNLSHVKPVTLRMAEENHGTENQRSQTSELLDTTPERFSIGKHI